MELFFLAILIILMAAALGSGFPVAFALPGSSIITILLAAISGYLFVGEVDAYFAQGGPGQWLSAGVTNLRGVYWEPDRDTLIAIPLFIFMGIMFQRSKIAEDLLITMAQLFGPIRGGLGISVVFVGALLAATTGIVGATVVAMGLISLPAMLRNNYSKPLATGTIAASGTLGQIIPPSIVLIILADQLASAADQAGTIRKSLFKDATGELSMPSIFDIGSTSAGEMFLGAFVPGIVLVLIYMAFILIWALFNPKAAPAVPYEGEYNRAFAVKVAITLIPPLTLILLVLGSIIAGIATVNQAGAIGAAGATIMAGYKLREGHKGAYYPAILSLLSLIALGFISNNFDINIKAISTSRDAIGAVMAVIAVTVLIVALIWSAWRAIKIEDTMQGVIIDTAKTTSLVFIILLGAAILTAAFRAFGGEELVKEFLTGLPGGFWAQFVIVMAVIFVLGFFLDFIEIAVVVVPIVSPILLADPGANITAVWLGVMIGLNIQTSFLTPPFGFALFYLRGVAPAIVKTLDMYKGVVAFIILQLIALGIVGLYPQLVNYLPQRVSLTSETAPPPRNPRLQYCVEEYLHQQFTDNGAAITNAIGTARGLDYSYLPRSLAKDVTDSFDDAEEAMAVLDQAKQAEADVAAAAPAYRPMHAQVRDIEADVRKIDREIEEIETLALRARGDDAEERRAEYEHEIEELKAEKERIAATVPENWNDISSDFAEIRKAEEKLRTQFRRTSDGAYEPIAELQRTIAGTPAYLELRGDLESLQGDLTGGDSEAMMDRIQEIESRVGEIEGAGDIRSALSKVRRALRGDDPEWDVAREEMINVMSEYEDQIGWRERASNELADNVAQYELAIRETIGIRQQERLTHEQALYVASCSANHRDISLSF